MNNLKDEYIILAIDPSLKQTGWSVLKISNEQPLNFDNKHIELLDYGIIPTHTLSHGKALMYFEKIISTNIINYKPDYVCAESPFVGNNRDTIQKLAHIHGVMQLTCAKAQLDIVYFSVMTAKSQTLDGIKTKFDDGTKKTGDEMKQEVADKVVDILGEKSFFKEYNLDVTDSISLAITFVKLEGKPPVKAKKTKKKTIKKDTEKEPKKVVKKTKK